MYVNVAQKVCEIFILKLICGIWFELYDACSCVAVYMHLQYMWNKAQSILYEEAFDSLWVCMCVSLVAGN